MAKLIAKCPDCGAVVRIFIKPEGYMDVVVDSSNGRICWELLNYEHKEQYLECTGCPWTSGFEIDEVEEYGQYIGEGAYIEEAD